MPNDPNASVLDGNDLIRVFSTAPTPFHPNGYVDDLSISWDFMHDENDPADDTCFGHGTGEARDSTSEANNGRGGAGRYPRCIFIPTRVGDGFITDPADFGWAVVYAVDRGASVVQEALGTSTTPLLPGRDRLRVQPQRGDHRQRGGRELPASQHARHRQPHGLHAIRFDSENINSATTFLNFNNCTNYGAQLVLSVGAMSCSSAAVGYESSGMARAHLLRRPRPQPQPGDLRQGEVKQLLTMTADDVYAREPADADVRPLKYPSLVSWDRASATAAPTPALAGVGARQAHPGSGHHLPALVPGARPRPSAAQQALRIACIAATARHSFDYTIEYATGVERGRRLGDGAPETNNTAAVIKPPVVSTSARSASTTPAGREPLRSPCASGCLALRRPINGDVPGESGARSCTTTPRCSRASRSTWAAARAPPHLVDLSSDGAGEIIYATSDGEVHTFHAGGPDLPGWPAFTRLAQGYDPAPRLASRAFRLPSPRAVIPTIDPTVVREAVLSTPAIGDLDGDVRPRWWSFRRDHPRLPRRRHRVRPRLPYTLPEVPSNLTSPQVIQCRGMVEATRCSQTSTATCARRSSSAPSTARSTRSTP
ncbi:MAG: hypothetical protein IPF99_40925 [Deltaproteobacteria bacterium]|nr:hypothetical protein [Deltaproteobacteria bacterium]